MQIDRHQIFRAHQFIGQGTGGDQETSRNPHRHVAGSALIQPEDIHAAGCIQQLTTLIRMVGHREWTAMHTEARTLIPEQLSEHPAET